MRSRVVRLLCSFCFFLLPVSALAEQPPAVPRRIVDRIDEAKRTVLRGNTHRLARPEFDRGAAPPDLPLNRMLLILKRSPGQEAALLKLLDDQQSKASADYHKWLTPESFGKQFGPANEDIQTVRTWLQSHGFQIGKVAKGRNMIEFSGVARNVNEAFHTEIHKFVVNGEEHWANVRDPQIPTALAPVVAGVHTLHNFLKQPMLRVAEQRIQAKLATGKDGKPHVTFPGNPALHALGPADFATIYNSNPLLQLVPPTNGFGSGIAVVARSNIDTANIGDFVNVFGLNGSYSNPQVSVALNGPDPGDLGGSEELEATLDASWAVAVAPGADVGLVVSASTNTTDGIDLSEAYIVDRSGGGIMSESFGACEASQTNAAAQGYLSLAEQAAAEGITYLVASGDSGAEGCDNPDIETLATGPLSVNVLAATPFNLAVGGTEFNENGQDSKYWKTTNDQYTADSALSYIPENVWNESCLASQCADNAGIWASGGGVSTFFSKPTWQAGVTGIPNDGQRDLPDVSLTAAGHDPYLICIQRSCVPDSQGFVSFFAVSGTSASTPSFAGIMAMVNQKMGGPQGHAGYVLYKLASAEKLSSCNASSTSGAPASTCIFNDVTVGNNAVPGELNYGKPAAQYQSGTGYDLATGLGSVNITNLVNKWNTITFRPTSTSFSASPTTITHGQPVNFTATVAPQGGSGTPTGDVIVRVGYDGSLGTFTLNAGAVSGAFTSTPGGQWVTSAWYAGDQTFAPGASNAVLLTVAPEPSTTALSAQTLDKNYNFVPFTGGPYGSFAYFRADVKGQSGNGTPTGNVTFSDTAGSIPGNPFALNSQGNTATPNFFNSPLGGAPTGLYTLAPGLNSITASYGGDESFDASVSSPVTLAITQAASSAGLTFAGAIQGAIFTATINTNSGGNPPTGTVTFFVDGKQVGSPVGTSGVPASINLLTGALVGAQATAAYTDSTIANGSYTVKASYSGDQNYLGSTSASVPITIQPDFVLSADPNSLNLASPGLSGTLSLNILANDGYKGTVNFDSTSCSGLPKGASCAFSPTSVTGTGTAILTLTTTAPASAILQRNYGPRAWWLAVSGGVLVGVVLLGAPTRRRWSMIASLLLTGLMIVGLGCGGGNSSSSPPPSPPPPPPATPAGSYTVLVTATSGSLTHQVSLTLNVQ